VSERVRERGRECERRESRGGMRERGRVCERGSRCGGREEREEGVDEL